LKNPIFAKELRKGDKVNGRCDGWLTVKRVTKKKYTRYQNTIVTFEDDSERVYSEDDRVEAVRIR